jgi:hypothetical protein
MPTDIPSDRPQFERLLTALYARKVGGPRQVEFFDYAFASGDPRRAASVRVARMPVGNPDRPFAWFFGSLTTSRARITDASGHSHQFIGTYLTPHLALGELIAATMHYDRFVEPLGFGHTFPLNTKSPLRAAYSSGLVLKPGKFAHESSGAHEFVLDAEPIALLTVVPIRSEELELKKSQGLEALLDTWETSSRDLFAVDLKLE